MMKTRFIIAAFLLFTAGAGYAQQGQSWFAIGLKGGIGPSFLVNKNVWNDDLIQNQVIVGWAYGARISENINENNEIAADLLFNTIRQRYSLAYDDSATAKESEMAFQTMDVALLYRNHKNGSYFEIGPQYTFVRNASSTISMEDVDEANLDYYQPNYWAGLIGFGGNFIGGDNFDMLMGFRIIYAFDDILSDLGVGSNNQPYPMHSDLNAIAYDKYEKTSPLTILYMLEFNFDLGYFAKRTCGKGRRKFITF